MFTYVASLRFLASHGHDSEPPVGCGAAGVLGIAGASTIERIVSGIIAGVVGWVVVYPLDAVKSVMQAQAPDKPIYRSAAHCAAALVHDGGLGRLYRGLGFQLIRAVPAA